MAMKSKKKKQYLWQAEIVEKTDQVFRPKHFKLMKERNDANFGIAPLDQEVTGENTENDDRSRTNYLLHKVK